MDHEPEGGPSSNLHRICGQLKFMLQHLLKGERNYLLAFTFNLFIFIYFAEIISRPSCKLAQGFSEQSKMDCQSKATIREILKSPPSSSPSGPAPKTRKLDSQFRAPFEQDTRTSLFRGFILFDLQLRRSLFQMQVVSADFVLEGLVISPAIFFFKKK